MLRAFVYSDYIYDVKSIEQAVEERGQRAAYDATLRRAAYMTAGSLFFSAVANFALALYFLLPVPDAPAAQQAELYNYAVSKMTWMGLLIIGVPLLVTLMLVMRYLSRKLVEVSGLGEDRIFLPR